MKIFIRYFFKTLRIVLGPFMLLKERLQRPAGWCAHPRRNKALTRSAKAWCFTTTRPALFA